MSPVALVLKKEFPNQMAHKFKRFPGPGTGIWECPQSLYSWKMAGLSLDPDLSWGRLNMTPVAQTVKNLPAIQETQIRSLSWEDLLEKEMETDSRILAWEIPWTGGGLMDYSPQSHKELDTTEQLRLLLPAVDRKRSFEWLSISDHFIWSSGNYRRCTVCLEQQKQ